MGPRSGRLNAVVESKLPRATQPHKSRMCVAAVVRQARGGSNMRTDVCHHVSARRACVAHMRRRFRFVKRSGNAANVRGPSGGQPRLRDPHGIEPVALMHPSKKTFELRERWAVSSNRSARTTIPLSCGCCGEIRTVTQGKLCALPRGRVFRSCVSGCHGRVRVRMPRVRHCEANARRGLCCRMNVCKRRWRSSKVSAFKVSE